MSTHLKIAKTLAIAFTATLITAALPGILPAGAAGVIVAPPSTTTTVATTTPTCNYSLSTDGVTSFAIRCTGLQNWAPYIQSFNGTLCTTAGTCMAMNGNQLTANYTTQANYSAGAPGTYWYIASSEALVCPDTMSHETCALNGSATINGWLNYDPTIGCPSSSGNETGNYWLFPPNMGSNGDLCIAPDNPTQTYSNMCFHMSSLQTGSDGGTGWCNYDNGANAVNMINDGTNGATTTPPTAACTIEQLYGPATINAPQNYHYTGLMDPQTKRLLAVPATDPGFNPIPSSWKSYTTPSGEALNGFLATPNTLGQFTMDVNYTNASTTPATDLYCEDTSNAWYNLGAINTLITVAHNLLPAGTDCYAQIQLGWDPASWVVGAFQGMGCVITALFVTGVSNASSQLLTTVDSKAPISYLTDAVNASTTIVSAISTATTTGACSPPTFSPFANSTGYLHTLNYFKIAFPKPANICPSTIPSDTTAGELFGYRSYLWDFEAFGIWLATVAMLWRLLPWSRTGDGIQILEQFGGLSDHIMENGVEVYQTNEGSD